MEKWPRNVPTSRVQAPLPALGIVTLEHFRHPTSAAWYCIVVLICVFLTTNDIEHHFMGSFSIPLSSLFKSLVHFYWAVYFFIIGVVWFGCKYIRIFWMWVFSQTYELQTFSPCLRLDFLFSLVSFKEQRFLMFDEIQCIHFAEVVSQKSWPDPRSQDFSPLFSSRNFPSRFVIHCDFIVTCGIMCQTKFFFSTYDYSVVSEVLVEHTITFLLTCLYAFVKKKN